MSIERQRGFFELQAIGGFSHLFGGISHAPNRWQTHVSTDEINLEGEAEMSAIHWLSLVSFCALVGVAYAIAGPFVAVAVFWSVLLGSVIAGHLRQEAQAVVELNRNE